MIKLYLHCGYHKTGSSFLQSLFALNREELLKNDIYFPKSKEEKEMLSGNISPGNGMELVNAIRKMDKLLIVAILKKWKDEAVINTSDKLLISSEGLFHVLAKSELMEIFVDACNKVEFEDLNALLFFRDPVSHAFSVYKHRGKRGGIPDYADWLNNNYETLDLTKSFLSFYNKLNIKWTFRKYKSDSDFISKVTFEDWLKIKIPETKLDKHVNTSLTLSEILMMTEVKHLLPQEYLVEIHRKLIELPKSKKANDVDLQTYYKDISRKELIKYEEVIININKLLRFEESLLIKETIDKNNIKNENVSLSRDQIKIFFEFIQIKNNLFSRANFFIIHIVKRIKRKISTNNFNR